MNRGPKSPISDVRKTVAWTHLSQFLRHSCYTHEVPLAGLLGSDPGGGCTTFWAEPARQRAKISPLWWAGFEP